MSVNERCLETLLKMQGVNPAWAQVDVSRDPDSGQVCNFCALVCNPQMRHYREQFTGVTDVQLMDATWTVSTLNVSVYPLLGIVPASAGDAVPLAFFFELHHPPQTARTAHRQPSLDVSGLRKLRHPAALLNVLRQGQGILQCLGAALAGPLHCRCSSATARTTRDAGASARLGRA